MCVSEDVTPLTFKGDGLVKCFEINYDFNGEDFLQYSVCFVSISQFVVFAYVSYIINSIK